MSKLSLPRGAKQHSTAGPYSPVLAVSAAEMVVISGQGPLDERGRVIGATFAEQVNTTLDNCATALGFAGVGFADVFRVTGYLSDLDDWTEFNEIYVRRFREPYPVRTVVGAKLLLGMRLEIEMWASR